jgi:hypothetical protein
MSLSGFESARFATEPACFDFWRVLRSATSIACVSALRMFRDAALYVLFHQAEHGQGERKEPWLLEKDITLREAKEKSHRGERQDGDHRHRPPERLLAVAVSAPRGHDCPALFECV